MDQIPKVIHYCWFGRNPLPPSVEACIQSWKQFCPDYEIIEWNEDNFDIGCCDYMREAYEAQKWAFVSDVARLLIVYRNGGIYLDTDVELIAPLEPIRAQNAFFFGIETNTGAKENTVLSCVNTGIGFGASPMHPVVKALMAAFDGQHFQTEAGFDLTPCPIRNSRALEAFGFDGMDKMYSFLNGTIYPSEYFCPLEFNSPIKHFSSNTVSIHHFDNSWHTPEERYYNKLFTRYNKYLPNYLSYQLATFRTAIRFQGFFKGTASRLAALKKKMQKPKNNTKGKIE